jgi:hypothetical protein
MSLAPIYIHPRVPTKHIARTDLRSAPQPRHRRVSEMTPSDIQARRQLLEDAKELGRMGIDQGPLYPEPWHEVDISENYFRMKREEEAQIREDVERAIRAQNRARARMAARAMAIANENVPSLTHSYSSVSYNGPPRSLSSYRSRSRSSSEQFNSGLPISAFTVVRTQVDLVSPSSNGIPRLQPSSQSLRGTSRHTSDTSTHIYQEATASFMPEPFCRDKICVNGER